VTKVISELSPITIIISHDVVVPFLHPLYEIQRKHLPHQGFLSYVWDNQTGTQFLEFSQMIVGIFIFGFGEGLFLKAM